MQKKILEKKPFPKPISFRKLIGPSFIILALGLGSGEIILWPYLVSNYGLGIVWGAILGISFQYFINMEIERYALVKGESVFVGLNKLWHGSAYWFIISTFVGFGLPGIVAASAELMANVFGFDNFKWLAIAFLFFIGLILSLGKTVYGMMEKTTRTIIMFGVPFIFILAIILASKMHWISLFQGLVGHGQDYNFLPVGISMVTFLAAFAYSGAGGNLNLTQSIYIKEKGYGMGKYSHKIAGLFASRGSNQDVKLEGEDCEINEENIKRFKSWWKRISLEHLLVFWFVGGLSMLLLMILSYSTVFGLDSNKEGISFVINEGLVISQTLFPWVGSLFLFVLGVMLFQTQLGIIDSTSRIMAENFAINKIFKTKNSKINLSKIYFIFLWAQIAFGIILFLFNFYEPKQLIVLGAVINSVAMFVHIGLVAWLNNKELPKVFRPGLLRKIIIGFIFLFFGFFSGFVLFSNFFG
ncbi:MAG: Nramp family divalent metal transporter [Candidatus Magasanikbacteria bacterium]